MVITYYGLSCFKAQSGNLVIAFDPPSKNSDLKPPRFVADIVLSSHNHPAHNGLGELSAKDDNGPFLISGPGEYEIKEVQIHGIGSFHDNEHGKKLGANTIYTVEIEGIRLCHLGDLGEEELAAQTIEAIGEVDILFLPVGGKDVIGAETAVKIANQIEPKIAVPMHYSIPKTPIKGEKVEIFLKELGEEKVEPEEKFTFKKKDLPEEGLKVVLLEPSISL